MPLFPFETSRWPLTVRVPGYVLMPSRFVVSVDLGIFACLLEPSGALLFLGFPPFSSRFPLSLFKLCFSCLMSASLLHGVSRRRNPNQPRLAASPRLSIASIALSLSRASTLLLRFTLARDTSSSKLSLSVQAL